MKSCLASISLLLLSSIAACARDATFAWNANPVTDAVTYYRLETQVVGGQWVSAGTVIDQGTGLATELRLPTFPNESTSVRVFAGNTFGESDASEVLVIGPTPGQVKGLRFTLTPKVASVEISEPGKSISIEQSTDLNSWFEIGKGWEYVVMEVPHNLPRAFFRAVIS